MFYQLSSTRMNAGYSKLATVVGRTQLTILATVNSHSIRPSVHLDRVAARRVGSSAPADTCPRKLGKPMQASRVQLTEQQSTVWRQFLSQEFECGAVAWSALNVADVLIDVAVERHCCWCGILACSAAWLSELVFLLHANWQSIRTGCWLLQPKNCTSQIPAGYIDPPFLQSNQSINQSIKQPTNQPVSQSCKPILLHNKQE